MLAATPREMSRWPGACAVLAVPLALTAADPAAATALARGALAATLRLTRSAALFERLPFLRAHRGHPRFHRLAAILGAHIRVEAATAAAVPAAKPVPAASASRLIATAPAFVATGACLTSL